VRAQTFEDVDLSEEWTEFDDKNNEPVSVMNIKYEFRPHRG